MPTAPDALARSAPVRLVPPVDGERPLPPVTSDLEDSMHTQVSGRSGAAAPRSTIVDSGVLLAGKYRLDMPLGEGAMGKVWLAQHEALGRRVALKVLHREVHADPQLRERFRREVRAVAELDHPGIVAAFDCGTLADGRVYLAMEYVEGRSLEQLLRSRGRLPWEATRRVARDLFEALAHAHDHGLVHRDLKPANLIVAAGDPVGRSTRILDLGIARRTDRLRGSTLTQAGEYIGTPAYSAPEHLRGERVGPRADLFSAGALLYRAVTGELPFAGRTFAEVTYAQHQGPALPPVLRTPDPERPAAFDALMLSLLRRDPAGRPSSARHVCQRLDEIDARASAPPLPIAGLVAATLLGAALLGVGAVAGGLLATLL